MLRLLLLSGLLLPALVSHAQVPVRLSMNLKNAGEPLVTGQPMPALNGVAYQIDDIAFYVSKVVIVHDGGQEHAIDSVYLFSDHSTDILLDSIDLTAVEGIRFMVGVPQELNHQDISQYASDHPLSYQSPSMFWGWSAGYMHFIMDGYGDGNNDGQPDNSHPFQLHCLGDANTQDVIINAPATVLPDGARIIVLLVNVDQWIEGTDPAATGIVHGSDGVNQQVMENVQQNPVFVSPQNAGISEPEKQAEITIALQGGGAFVSWKSEVPASSYDLTGTDGRILRSGSCNSSSVLLSGLGSGMHIVRLYGPGKSILGSAKWINP
jgi:hypothetical protein